MNNKLKLPFLFLVSFVLLLFWTLLRSFFVFKMGFNNLEGAPIGLIFLRGAWFDLTVLSFIFSIIFLANGIGPKKFLNWSYFKKMRWIVIWFFILTTGLLCICEVIFWNEFSTRFNFIAIDYLVYTQEVIGNIMQSYPVIPILGALFVFSLVITFILQRMIIFSESIININRRLLFVILGVLSFIIMASAHLDQFTFTKNTYGIEISSNGIFNLFAAYRRNELKYDSFYKTIPQKQADEILLKLGVERKPFSESQGLVPEIKDTHENYEMGPFIKHPKNVVIITVESLSADFMNFFGNKSNITPHLDALINESYFFTNFFATGTRTVRGLESLSLAIPPIPGQAVVRRENIEHLATIGETLLKQGFSTYFIYGGYSYFDNMSNYFLANDYQVMDRNNFVYKTTEFSNVWGVADETLFDNALDILNSSAQTKKPFLAQIMTTSNHRPYTYPDGRIDIPSPGGRNGAVKYTDYAIHRFLDMAKKTSWFDETLFVIVADHCASVAGRSALPIKDYRIPLFFYGPKLVKPGRYDRIASQIDIVPTLLDVLGVDGDQYFFGESMFEFTNKPGRAFISNYQNLGYYKDNRLTILKPKSGVETYSVNPKNLNLTLSPLNENLMKEAISYYQTADRSLRGGALKARLQ